MSTPSLHNFIWKVRVGNYISSPLVRLALPAYLCPGLAETKLLVAGCVYVQERILLEEGAELWVTQEYLMFHTIAEAKRRKLQGLMSPQPAI